MTDQLVWAKGRGGVRRLVTAPNAAAVDAADLAEAEALAEKYARENKRLREALRRKGGRRRESRFCVCGCWLLVGESCPNCALALGVNPHEGTAA